VAELVADNDRIAADNARLAEEQAKNRAQKAANDREIAQLMGAGASDDAETAPRPTNGVRTQRATEAGTPAPARRGKPKLRWKEAALYIQAHPYVKYPELCGEMYGAVNERKLKNLRGLLYQMREAGAVTGEPGKWKLLKSPDEIEWLDADEEGEATATGTKPRWQVIHEWCVAHPTRDGIYSTHDLAPVVFPSEKLSRGATLVYVAVVRRSPQTDQPPCNDPKFIWIGERKFRLYEGGPSMPNRG